LNAFGVVAPAQEVDDIFEAGDADDPRGDLIVHTRRKDHLLGVGYPVILFLQYRMKINFHVFAPYELFTHCL
jgi:hypothetical protein